MRRLPLAALALGVLAAQLVLASPLAPDPEPYFELKWGSYGGGDGQFREPYGVAVDAEGNVYVADSNNNRIQRFDAGGNYITAWYASKPYGMTVDADGYVYAAENLYWRKYDPDGNLVYQWRAAVRVYGIAVDSSGNVYISWNSGSNHKITRYEYVAVNQYEYDNKTWSSGRLPYGLAFDSSDHLYVADWYNGFYKYDTAGNLLLRWGTPGTGPGEYGAGSYLAVDANDDVYAIDYRLHRVQKFDGDGNFLLMWGAEGAGDGQFQGPSGIATGPGASIYVAEAGAGDRVQKFGTIPPPTPVAIDIKPGDGPNSVNPKSKGLIPVAILTTSVAAGDAFDFDAISVDAFTVAFGPAEAGKAHPRQPLGHYEDLDGDGDIDLLLHFETQETGIACGITEATLTGQTLDGVEFVGSDSVNTVGCR